MKCQRLNCEDKGEYHVLLCCPALPDEGKKIPEAVIFIGLRLCKLHAKRFEVQAFLDTPTPAGNGTNKVLFEMALAPYDGKPDFERAHAEPIRVGSDRAKKFTAARDVANGANKSIPPQG